MEKTDPRDRIYLFKFKWAGPRYYDYPDGQDLIGKLSYTSKAGFFFGATLGIMYPYRISSVPPTPKVALFKAFMFTVPCVAAPVAFTLVTYAATNYRKKDDQFNYICGSVAAAAVGTTLARIPKYTVPVAIAFSAVGFAKKTCQMYGTQLLPPIKARRWDSTYYRREFDFSLVKERPATWTSELPAISK